MSREPGFIEHKATTEFAANRTIDESESMKAWLETLSPDEQNRFREFAHHLYHTAFTDGLKRNTGPGITNEQRAEVLGHQVSIYLQGVDDANQFNEPEGVA